MLLTDLNDSILQRGEINDSACITCFEKSLNIKEREIIHNPSRMIAFLRSYTLER